MALSLATLIIVLQIVFFTSALGILIYLVIKRYKKKEDFEKRDN